MNRYGFGARIGFVILASFLFFLSSSEAAEQLYLTGRVLSKSASPVSSVWVEVRKNGQRVGRSLTGDEGRYYVSRLERGTYEMVVVRGREELFRGPLDLNGNMTLDIHLSDGDKP